MSGHMWTPFMDILTPPRITPSPRQDNVHAALHRLHHGRAHLHHYHHRDHQVLRIIVMLMMMSSDKQWS